FAGAALDRLDGEFYRVDAGGGAAAMGEDLPGRTVGAARGLRLAAPRVDGDDDALVAELVGSAGHEIGIVHRGGIDGHLVGAAEEGRPALPAGAHAGADGNGREALLGRPRGDVEDRLAIVRAGGDVEEAQLVRPRRVIGAGRLDRIAGIDEIDELHALD